MFGFCAGAWAGLCMGAMSRTRLASVIARGVVQCMVFLRYERAFPKMIYGLSLSITSLRPRPPWVLQLKIVSFLQRAAQ